MRLLDVNDNAPEFSSSSYVSSVLLKDAEAGQLLLRLAAADRDAGSNSLVTYRSVLEARGDSASRPTAHLFSSPQVSAPAVLLTWP